MSSSLAQEVVEKAKAMREPTIGQLIDAIVLKTGLDRRSVTKAVYIEYKQGSLQLCDGVSSNLWRYFICLENAWFWGATALVAMTLLVVFTVNSSALLYARYVLGGVFVLFLPGFLLISALYARSEEMDTLERLALSIGLSLAVVPLIGLVLNYTPWGIRLEPIMVSLALFSEVMAVVCVVRRFRYYRLSLK